MPDEEAKEGVDLDGAYQDQTSDDTEAKDAEEAGESDSAEAEASDGAEDEAATDSDGGDETGGLDDLMDIFSDESDVADSDAGLLDEFMEELTMDQVSGEADRLLEEFRAI